MTVDMVVLNPLLWTAFANKSAEHRDRLILELERNVEKTPAIYQQAKFRRQELIEILKPALRGDIEAATLLRYHQLGSVTPTPPDAPWSITGLVLTRWHIVLPPQRDVQIASVMPDNLVLDFLPWAYVEHPIISRSPRLSLDMDTDPGDARDGIQRVIQRIDGNNDAAVFLRSVQSFVNDVFVCSSELADLIINGLWGSVIRLVPLPQPRAHSGRERFLRAPF